MAEVDAKVNMSLGKWRIKEPWNLNATKPP